MVWLLNALKKYYCFDTHSETEKLNLLENALKIS